MNRKRVWSLLLALVLCLTLLPTAAFAAPAAGAPFDITFDASPGTFSDGSTTKIQQTAATPAGENLVTAPADTPTRSGYTFNGWYVNSPNENPGFANTNFQANATVHANWQQNAPVQQSYRINFDPHGGLLTEWTGIVLPDLKPGNPPEYFSGNDGDYGSLGIDQNSGIGWTYTDDNRRVSDFPAAERAGFIFDGWYLDGLKIGPGQPFDGNATLKARWTRDNSGYCEVSFDLNFFDKTKEKASERPQTKTVLKGNTVSLPDGSKLTPPADTHEFYAWCVATKNSKGEIDLFPWNQDSPVKESMTLYAAWIRKGQVVVNGQPIKASDANGSSTAAPAATPTATPAAPAATPAANPFTDVGATSPFYNAILWAVKEGITNGTTPTTFSPSNTCTRGHILTFLWRSQGSPEPTIANPFQDAIPSAFQKAAIWAYEKGLVTGTTFGASTPCTRAASVTYMWKLAGSPDAAAAPFSDVSSLDAPAVNWAVAQGVTNGTSATTFDPGATCTRGQIVTFLYRAYAGV